MSSVSWMLEWTQDQARFPVSGPLQAPRSSALLRCCRECLHASRCPLRACWRAALLLRPMRMLAIVMAPPVHMTVGSSTFSQNEMARNLSCQLNLWPSGGRNQLLFILKHARCLQRALQKHLKRHSQLILKLQIALPLGRGIAIWRCCILLAVVSCEVERFQIQSNTPCCGFEEQPS